MTKNATRRTKFQAIGQAITAIKQGDPDSPDYHTGQASRFYKRNGPSAEVNTIHGIGPVFKTPQWVRTVKTLATVKPQHG